MIKKLALRVMNYMVDSKKIANQAQASLFQQIKFKVFSYLTFLIERVQHPYGKDLEKIKKLYKYLGSCEVFVLGNGPSLKTLNFQELKTKQSAGTKVICVNYFPLYSNKADLIPDYLVISDRGMVPKSEDNLSQRLWKWIAENPKVILFLPYTWSDFFSDAPVKNEIIYFNDLSMEGITSNINPVKPRGYLSMTAYKALAIACYITSGNIYIVGIDNSNFYKIRGTKDNEIVQESFHFEDLWNGHWKLSSIGMDASGYFYDLAVLFKNLGYFKNESIYNLHQESLVDVFPKLSLPIVSLSSSQDN